MYLDLPACDNLPEPVMATFKETGAGQAVRAARLWRDGEWQWCAVTGWGEGGAETAWCTPIEESGDGPARLLHGGEHGMRLAAIADPDQAVTWDLADAGQWAEPFLICRPELEVRPAPGP